MNPGQSLLPAPAALSPERIALVEAYVRAVPNMAVQSVQAWILADIALCLHELNQRNRAVDADVARDRQILRSGRPSAMSTGRTRPDAAHLAGPASRAAQGDGDRGGTARHRGLRCPRPGRWWTHTAPRAAPPWPWRCRPGCAAGIGYLPGPGIDSTWTETDFARIRAAGLGSIAYASGRADPLAQRALAKSWRVIGCLDVEASIRGDGPWVQPWLDASGFGIYHEAYRDPPYRAPFHIIAEYVASDPGSSWPPGLPRPAGPTGWQWMANVALYATNLDRCRFDPALYGPSSPPPPPEDPDMQTLVIEPGDPRTPVPGYASSSSFSLVAYQSTAVTLFAYQPDGAPLCSPTIDLSGNLPNQDGPRQYGGLIRNLPGFPPAYSGPVTLVLYPAAAPYTISLS